MNRTPLTRRTPLNSRSELKRTPLKRMSDKKRKEKRDTDQIRKLVRTDPLTGKAVACCVCGDDQATETHEIARGAARSQAVYYPRLQLPVCRECHELLDDYFEWPIERQLAVSVLLTIQEANKVRGRAPDAITITEVAAWL